MYKRQNILCLGGLVTEEKTALEIVDTFLKFDFEGGRHQRLSLIHICSDLGAEKFLDIKCRLAGLKPDAVVVVATVRALKNHGGVAKADLNEENLEALEAGLPNLLQHVENITQVYRLPCVVAINAFPTDTKAELDLVEAKCRELGVNVALSEVWAKGGEGGQALATEVVRLCAEGDAEGRSAETFEFSYDDDLTLAEKIDVYKRQTHRRRSGRPRSSSPARSAARPGSGR